MTSSASSVGFDFVDPFGASADPARYVPRAATQRALERLVHAVRDEHRSVLLSGTPGIGKTLLLRLLARYLGPELRTVHLPYASMPAAALCAWAVDLLGGGSSYDPVGAVVALARRPHADGVGLVLLIDDAEAMPEGSAQQLARAARESGGALRIVAALAEAAAAPLAEGWDDAERVTLREPMDLEETSRYVAAHLETAGLPEAARAAFDASIMSEIHRRSGGVPGRVNPEASVVLRRVLAWAGEERSEVEASEAAFERAAGRLALEHSEPGYEDLGEETSPALERAAGRLTLAQMEPEPVVEAPPEAEPAEAEAVAEELPQEEPPEEELPEAEPPLETGGALVEPPAESERALAGAGAPAVVAAEPSAQAEVAVPAASVALPGAEEYRAAATQGARRGPAWANWLIVFGVFFAIGGGLGIWLGQRRPAEPETQPSAPQPPAGVSEEAVAPASAAAPAASVSVQINANPWATILVDGEEVGITPLAGVPVGAGPHTFEARFPDGRVVERVVEIDEVNRFVVFP